MHRGQLLYLECLCISVYDFTCVHMGRMVYGTHVGMDINTGTCVVGIQL